MNKTLTYHALEEEISRLKAKLQAYEAGYGMDDGCVDRCQEIASLKAENAGLKEHWKLAHDKLVEAQAKLSKYEKEGK